MPSLKIEWCDRVDEREQRLHIWSVLLCRDDGALCQRQRLIRRARFSVIEKAARRRKCDCLPRLWELNWWGSEADVIGCSVLLTDLTLTLISEMIKNHRQRISQSKRLLIQSVLSGISNGDALFNYHTRAMIVCSIWKRDGTDLDDPASSHPTHNSNTLERV